MNGPALRVNYQRILLIGFVATVDYQYWQILIIQASLNNRTKLPANVGNIDANLWLHPTYGDVSNLWLHPIIPHVY